MKKVISINFKGRVIPIEEDAFEILQHYIESLRRYFAKEEGRDEIINDIEDRIAELFSDILKNNATCITETDVNEIILNMGRVEDFEATENIDASENEKNNSEQTEPRGNITRNATDKILGGVCAGLAHYLKIDPTVMRILFAIVTFGGFGLGVFIYIILWIVLPEKPLPPNIKKRIFRDPENKMVGGVAAGIAAYFNIAVWVPRLIFLLPGALGLFGEMIFDGNIVFAGGLGGSLFVAYIVLWIVLPVAKSGIDKMQMRGEKIDLNAIRNQVKGEMGSLQERAEKFGTEVSEGATRFATEASSVGNRVGNTVGKTIGILFKALFMFIVGIIAFALLITLFSLGFAGTVMLPVKGFLFEDGVQTIALWGTVLLFLFVPAIAILIWLVRKMIGAKPNPYFGYVFGVLWFFGWVSVSVLGTLSGKDFSYEAEVEEIIPLKSPMGQPLLLSVNEEPVRYSGVYWWIQGDDEGWDINEDTLKYSNIKVLIEGSPDTSYSASIIRSGYGKNRKDAEARAEKIQYRLKMNESGIDLGSTLAIGKKEKFRAQQVVVLIRVPVGKKIKLGASVEERLHPFYVRINKTRGWKKRNRRSERNFDSYFEYKTNTEYMMTEGGLVELDAKGNLIKPAVEPEIENNEPRKQKDNSVPNRYEYKKKDFNGAKPIAEHETEPYEWYMFRVGEV